jgi:hypothetical protein
MQSSTISTVSKSTPRGEAETWGSYLSPHLTPATVDLGLSVA